MAGRGRENDDFGLAALRQAALRTIGQNALLLNQRPRSASSPELGEHLALMRAPKLGSPWRKGDGRIGPVPVGDIAGKIWNAPNTVLGLAYGSVGHAVGEVWHALAPNSVAKPQVVVGDNAVQFRDNPFGGVSAITIGNTSTYGSGNADRGTIQHEKQHTYQGQQLGPAYLPSNLLGGLTALYYDRDKHVPDWHGPHNWNERGPQLTPPRPWPDGERR